MGEINAFEKENTDGRMEKFLTFHIGSGTFGIGIRYIIEIIRIQPITKLPQAPDYIRGVIDLRGRIVPVMDVQRKFGNESLEYTDRTCVVIVRSRDITFGLIVDGVEEIVTVSEEAITPPPGGDFGVGDGYVNGIAKCGDGVRILLDCDKLLNCDEESSIGTPSHDLRLMP